MLIRHGENDPRVQVKFMDLTMLAVEYGTPMSEIPEGHPDAKKFNSDRPFLDEEFDHVLCDGQILRTHFREEYRQNREVIRLNVAQLIFGMTRIKSGGTFVMLLHKADAFDNVELLSTFDAFSKVKLCKPRSAHAVRSSFYLIATDVDPTHSRALEALKQWKKDWENATFEEDGGTGMNKEIPTEDVVLAVLEKFGPRLIEMAREIWQIQKNALGKASYTKTTSPWTPTGGWPRSPHTKTFLPGTDVSGAPRSPYTKPTAENNTPQAWRKASVSRVEALKPDFPKLRSPRAGSPRAKLNSAEVSSPWAKFESPKVNSPEVNSPKVYSPKVNSPKVYSPKVDSPKVDTPKAGSPGAKSASVEVDSPKTQIKVAETLPKSPNVPSDWW